MTLSHITPPRDERGALERLQDDVERLSLLAAMCRDLDAAAVADTFLDTLIDMLSLDLAALRLDDGGGVVVRARPGADVADTVDALRTRLGADRPVDIVEGMLQIGDGSVPMMQCPVPGSPCIASIVVGARRAGFPDRTALATLRLAAAQAALAFPPSMPVSVDGELANACDRALDAQGRRAGNKRLKRAEDALRASEAALRESERELQQIVSSIPGLTWRADAQGSITFWSQGFLDYADASIDRILGYGFLDYIHPDDRDNVMETWVGILQSRRTGESEVRLRRADGQYRWFLWQASPFFDSAGELTQWFGINVDIENRKRAEERLQQTQNDLAHATRMTTMGELAVSIAHEVNQPLMAIVTNAGACLRWLSDSHTDIAMARKAVERIVRDGHRAGDIIVGLRQLARKSAPHMDRLCIDDIVPTVLDLLQGEFRRHGVVAKAQLGEGGIAILGDRTQLQQVVLNLAMNAVEAMAGADVTPRRLLVRAEARDGAAVISVSDTGPGLGLEDPDRLFEAFFSTKAAGIGMGLSICRSIIEAHGGTIWAASQRTRGSVFSFTVPLAEGNGTHGAHR